jgi:hypothetical protein
VIGEQCHHAVHQFGDNAPFPLIRVCDDTLRVQIIALITPGLSFPDNALKTHVSASVIHMSEIQTFMRRARQCLHATEALQRFCDDDDDDMTPGRTAQGRGSGGIETLQMQLSWRRVQE